MSSRALITLLLTMLIVQSPLISSAEDATEIRVRQLINALGCKGCHKLEGDGGSLAPELDKIGSRLTSVQISKHLAAPATSRKKGFMPSYNTTSQAELNSLSDFLYNLH